MSIAVVLAIVIGAYTIGPMLWGGNGELDLTITLDAASMPLGGSIGCQYTLTNMGTTSIRILPPRPIVLYIYMVGSGNATVPYTGPVSEPKRYMNDDLVTLRPDESWRGVRTIDAGDWALVTDETYTVSTFYSIGEELQVWLPHWQGYIRSNEVQFTVT